MSHVKNRRWSTLWSQSQRSAWCAMPLHKTRKYHERNQVCRCLSYDGPAKQQRTADQERRRKRSLKQTLENVLENVGTKQIPNLVYKSPTRVRMEGTAKHLGLRAEWKQEFCTSGAFWEELKNEHMHIWWGFDGKEQVWEVDFSGLPSLLELDDRETSLLCTWVRNGMWLIPHIREKLHINFAPESEPQDWQLLREQSESYSSYEEFGEDLGNPQYDNSSPDASGEIILDVRLKEGKVTARLVISKSTWLPTHLILPVCGDIEKTDYNEWGELNSIVYPRSVKQIASGGGRNEYWASSAEAVNALDLDNMLFSIPGMPVFPPDTTYDKNLPPYIEFYQARSGHILVKPKINGQEIEGVMILDTGASGFVITKELADELALGAFGELYVAGVTQKVRSQFRKASNIQLGPVEMSNPLFMEMNIDGVVHGSPSPVVGILGYDFFRRAVVEVPPLAHNMNYQNGTNRITVHDPLEYEHHNTCDLKWQQLQLVANVPHINATFGKENGKEHSALFMLDSGAGGAGVMFHARASAQYQLLDEPDEESSNRSNGMKSIRGIGGESGPGGMKVVEGNISYLQVSGARFENVLSLIATRGGFDLSLHTAGMICADLMVQCRVIFDYPRRRFAMVQESKL